MAAVYIVVYAGDRASNGVGGCMKTTLTRGRVISRRLRSVCATNSPLNSEVRGSVARTCASWPWTRADPDPSATRLSGGIPRRRKACWTTVIFFLGDYVYPLEPWLPAPVA
ncbi:hypothetical protein V5799_006322 [Amblyomma americanum]|uniref:Uncharacterized protein n=1 Tax=Amblyomma americanum TaxID=6943 RepID=A0AAQ4DWR1_AMBAM